MKGCQPVVDIVSQATVTVWRGHIHVLCFLDLDFLQDHLILGKKQTIPG